MNTINKRYHLKKIVSEDATGKIYIATDSKKRNSKVFLKIFTLEESNEEFIKKLIKKFIRLKSISFKSIVDIYKFELVESVDGNSSSKVQYFYSYEYFDESKAVDYKKLSYDESRKAIYCILKTLEYLHFRGFVYRYLNFDNILFFRENGEIRVLFRDLVTIEMFDKSYKLNLIKYSNFIAPEVIWDSNSFFKSDIFSFGHLFYYLFYKYDISHSIDEIYDSTNNKIYEVIRKMISTFRNERYNSIYEVSSVIVKLLRLDIYEENENKVFNRIMKKTIFIGRENELKIVKNFMKVSTKDNKKSIIFYGENGIGKTRLLNEIFLMQKFLGEKIYMFDIKKSNNLFYNFKQIILKIISTNEIDPLIMKKYAEDLAKFDKKFSKEFSIESTNKLEGELENLKLANRISNFLKDVSKNTRLNLLLDNIENFSLYERNIFIYLNKLEKLNKIKIISTTDEEVTNDAVLNGCINNENVIIKKLMRFNYDDANNYVKEILGISYYPTNFTTKIMSDIGGNPNEIRNIIYELYRKNKISVSDEKKWIISDIDKFNEIVLEHDRAEEDFNVILSSLNTTKLYVLKILSLFKLPVHLKIISIISKINEKKLEKVIEELVEDDLVIKKFSDFGYSYVFKNKLFKNIVYNKLDKKNLLSSHEKISHILLEETKKNYLEYNEEVLNQLIFSKNYVKAINYLIDYADILSKKFHFLQSIDYLEKALDIQAEYSVLEINFIKILYKVGVAYFNSNKLKKAYEKFEQVSQNSMEVHDIKLYIDSNIYIVKILNKQLKFDDSEEILEKCTYLSKENSYIDGELESALMLCKTYIKKNDGVKLNELSEFYINFSESIVRMDYYARFLNESAKYNFMIKEYEISLAKLKECNALFRKLNLKKESSDILNNIGVIYSNYYGFNAKAREYFKKSIAEFNYDSGDENKIIYYLNVGETFFNEDEYFQSMYNLNKAYTLAETLEDSFYLFQISLVKCFLYIKLNDYEKAYSILKKLEIDYKLMDNNQYMNVSYYFVHIEYYLAINNFILAEIWINKLEQNNEGKKYSNKLEMNSFLLKNIKTKLSKDSISKNKRIIINFTNKIFNLNDIVYFRKILFRIAKKYVNSNDYFAIKEILDLDNALREMNDVKSVMLKRKIIEGVFVNDRKSYYLRILKEEKANLVKEDEWYLYKVLADEYYESQDYYNAIDNYYNALDIIKDLTDKIYVDHKLSYLFNDEIKIDLKNKIISLRNKVIKQTKNAIKLKFSDILYNNVEDFFDFHSIYEFYKDEKFLNTIVRTKKNFSIKNANELITSFTLNEKINLENLLMYFVNKTFADFGYIFMTDSSGNVVDYISSNKNIIPNNIDEFIKKSGSNYESVLLSKVIPNENNYLLEMEQKSIICIPIREMVDEKSENFHRRKTDDRVISKKNVGYIYLESRKIFNNFTLEILDHLEEISKLAYLMIENYNLKTIASRDKLTGVLLRAKVEDIFSNILFKAKTLKSNLSVAMVDIDKFKNINDSYGHLVGDKVLNAIGEILIESVRTDDMIGRYGGEEFILIFPDTRADEAYVVCEKIRKKIESHFIYEGEVAVTMSFGISEYPTHGISDQELIEKADKALYFSKNNGRNRCSIWSEKIGNESKRFNRLSGIVSGDVSKDTRNVQALLNIIDLAKMKMKRKKKLLIACKNLLDITESDYCTIVSKKNGNIEILTAKMGMETWVNNFIDKDLMEKYFKLNKGSYFVDWSNIIIVDEFDNSATWNSVIVSPIIISEENYGFIMLTVNISEKEFNDNDFNFVESITPVIASLI